MENIKYGNNFVKISNGLQNKGAKIAWFYH